TPYHPRSTPFPYATLFRSWQCSPELLHGGLYTVFIMQFSIPDITSLCKLRLYKSDLRKGKQVYFHRIFNLFDLKGRCIIGKLRFIPGIGTRNPFIPNGLLPHSCLRGNEWSSRIFPLVQIIQKEGSKFGTQTKILWPPPG